MLAILLAEEDAPTFRDLMGGAGRALVSAGTAVEFAAVASRNGDIFAYALAHEQRVPLLFKGDDFSQTDIEDARGSMTA